jgi:hypothetical protein
MLTYWDNSTLITLTGYFLYSYRGLDVIFKTNQMNKSRYWEACCLDAQTGNILSEKVKSSTNN